MVATPGARVTELTPGGVAGSHAASRDIQDSESRATC
jgi:hypothetical protein